MNKKYVDTMYCEDSREIPNATTLAAFAEAEDMEAHPEKYPVYDNVAELMEILLKDDLETEGNPIQTKYAFPAVFTLEESGGYSVHFPDVNGCYTSGETLIEATEMAKDALCLMLYHMEKTGKTIPNASDIEELSASVADNEHVSLIACDTMDYRMYYGDN